MLRPLILLFPLAACSTYLEDKAGLDYAPLYHETLPVAARASGGIFHDDARGLFVNDRRARNVGDVLTVQFVERFQASKSQSASSGRNSSFEVELPSILPGGLASGDFGSSTRQSFSGRGAASQSNSLTGRLSVSVARVLPNGHLEVIGQKRLTLNNGAEYVRLSGVVRPEDIGPDNVVTSDRLAHADIRYIGAGDVADTGRQGWLSRALAVVNPL
ncbi:MAG: flagellar basal body L-ring protein FlgH [Roseinatronobacter sp.]|nr:flagellar basal body L-ring protein FlgH [Roseinatronobacter sp.]